jgi:hypothetical protein
MLDLTIDIFPQSSMAGLLRMSGAWLWKKCAAFFGMKTQNGEFGELPVLELSLLPSDRFEFDFTVAMAAPSCKG